MRIETLSELNRAEVLKRGVVDGEWVELSAEIYNEIAARTPVQDPIKARLMALAEGIPPCAGCGG